MNALTTTTAAGGGFALVPSNMREAMDLANMMAKGRLVPQALQDRPADCLLVIEQATRWGMSPFAVAQEVSVISGKLMHSGKIVAAAIHGSGVLDGRLKYAFTGEGDNLAVVVTGKLRGDSEPQSVTVRLKDARTNNQHWAKSPEQMLSYHGARVWARRYAPEVMLGVYSPEEFEEPRTVPAQVMPGGMVDHLNQQRGEAPAEDPLATFADQGLPLIAPDGRLVEMRSKQPNKPHAVVWLDGVKRAIGVVGQDGPAALQAWRQSNGPHFASISELFPDVVRAAEALIDEALASAEAPELTE